jgi:hypothetical protein
MVASKACVPDRRRVRFENMAIITFALPAIAFVALTSPVSGTPLRGPRIAVT